MAAKIFVQAFLVILTNFMSSNSEKMCIKWDNSEGTGTKVFVDRIYTKYGKPRNSAAPRMMDRKDFNKLLNNLRIGTVLVKCQKDDDECMKNKFAFHALESKNTITTRKRRVAAIEKEEHETDEDLRKAHEMHWKKHITDCYKSVDFLSLHGVNDTFGISERDFLRMCPSIVQQIDNRMCVHHHKKIEHEGHLPTTLEKWGYGLASITIISLLSLSVIAMIPCLKKSYYAVIMAFLVALAVGTLAGDALLHLIPHAFVEGANSATNATISEADELNQHYSQVWRAMFVLLGLYVFFVVEQVMKLKAMCGGGGHDHGKGEEPDSPIVPTKELCLKTDEERTEKTSLCSQYESKGPSVAVEMKTPLEHSISCKSDVHNDHNHDVPPDGHFHADDRHHHHHHTGHGHGEKVITKETKISSVAWMVIVGDGFHNFSDGVAIGAAFSASITSGVSTAIAVFCHELPHELGDFAILVKSGMTIKQAVTYNIVSAVLAYVGLVVGILAGGNELGRHFILSITAGMFLYVSLADMLPELTHQDVPNTNLCTAFICQHLGLLTGVAIMLFISLYEHQM